MTEPRGLIAFRFYVAGFTVGVAALIVNWWVMITAEMPPVWVLVLLGVVVGLFWVNAIAGAIFYVADKRKNTRREAAR